jgi:hypothetical protein
VRLHLFALASIASLALSGCVTTETPNPPKPEPDGTISLKTHYSTFTDASWLPERTIRAPYGTPEIYPNIVDVLSSGIYAYYGTEESILTLEKSKTPGTFSARESHRRVEPTLSFSKGSGTLYRNGQPFVNPGELTAKLLEDGRLMFTSAGKAKVNVAVKLRAFNVSGKPVLHFMRNVSNQPDDLAWYTDKNITFPAGSEAYIATYWLGDDEVVVPAANSFTGTRSIEELMNKYSKHVAPLCMSYVHSQVTAPYGVIFPPISTTPVKVTREVKNAKGVVRRVTKMERPTAAQTGQLSLLKARTGTIFCEVPKESTLAKATWRMRNIQGTRVMEITPEKAIDPANIGVQPINRKSMGVGFAEIARTIKGKRTTAVVPVNILRNNEPIVDFRLKFNKTAAEAVRKAVHQAAEAKKREAKLIAEQSKKNRGKK